MRCDECGMKECCGASMGVEIARLTAELERLQQASGWVEVRDKPDDEYAVTIRSQGWPHYPVVRSLKN